VHQVGEQTKLYYDARSTNHHDFICAVNKGNMSTLSYYLLTSLLTPWSRVLLEKLTVNFAASQEITRIYGTRKFLTVPTSARHMSNKAA
jgi:hypothetical protein